MSLCLGSDDGHGISKIFEWCLPSASIGTNGSLGNGGKINDHQ